MIDRELLSAQKELTAHAFSQAQAYTNVVLLAGYAGFFAIWSFLKPELSKGQVFWSALLVSISLTVFILWEVYQAFYRSRSLFSLVKAVEDPANFHAHLAAHKDAENTRIIQLRWVWLAAYSLSVATGFSGVCVLLWAFMQTLWSLYVA